MLERTSDVLDMMSNHITKWTVRVLPCLIGGMTIAVVLTIISRYITKISIPWTEEISRYLMIWAAFLAGSLGLKKGVHVGIVVVVERIPRSTGKWISLIAKLSLLFFFLVVVVEGCLMTVFVSTQLSPVLRVSMAWVYSALPVGGTLFSFYVIQSIIEDLRRFSE